VSDSHDLQGCEDRRRLTRLGNVELDVAVEVGRAEMTGASLAGMKEQDVIEFPKLAGEAFDILLNGRKFAAGEVVVIADQLGVRVTELIDCEAGI